MTRATPPAEGELATEFVWPESGPADLMPLTALMIGLPLALLAALVLGGVASFVLAVRTRWPGRFLLLGGYGLVVVGLLDGVRRHRELDHMLGGIAATLMPYVLPTLGLLAMAVGLLRLALAASRAGTADIGAVAPRRGAADNAP